MLGSVSTKTTAMPASRSWSTTSTGPIEPSVITTVGRSARIASELTVWPLLVTTGRSIASGNVVEMSRPTTLSPNPRPNTVAAIEPEMSIGTIRSVDSTVTSVSPSRSWETTVAGSCCAGVGIASMSAAWRSAVDSPTYAAGSSSSSSSASGTRGPCGAVAEPLECGGAIVQPLERQHHKGGEGDRAAHGPTSLGVDIMGVTPITACGRRTADEHDDEVRPREPAPRAPITIHMIQVGRGG